MAPDDAFAVISTAAVDVVPRGAALTHANVLAANLTAIAGFGYTPADRYLLALPLFHITALGTALAHMHAGGASVVVSRYDPEEAVRLIDRHRVTHLSDFPPVLATLLDAAEKARQPAAEPARRGRPRRAADHPAAARRRPARRSGPASASRRPAASCACSG